MAELDRAEKLRLGQKRLTQFRAKRSTSSTFTPLAENQDSTETQVHLEPTVVESTAEHEHAADISDVANTQTSPETTEALAIDTVAAADSILEPTPSNDRNLAPASPSYSVLQSYTSPLSGAETESPSKSQVSPVTPQKAIDTQTRPVLSKSASVVSTTSILGAYATEGNATTSEIQYQPVIEEEASTTLLQSGNYIVSEGEAVKLDISSPLSNSISQHQKPRNPYILHVENNDLSSSEQTHTSGLHEQNALLASLQSRIHELEHQLIVQQQESQQQLESLKQQSAQEIEALKMQHSEALQSERMLRQTIEKNVAQEMSDIQSHLDQLTQEKDDLTTECTQLRNELSKTEGKLETQKKEMKELQSALEDKAAELVQSNALLKAFQDQLAQTSQSVGDERVVALENNIRMKDAEIETLRIHVAEKDTEIVSLKERVAAQDTDATSLHHALTAKDNEITSLQALVTQKDTYLHSLKEDAAYKDDQLMELKRQLIANNEELERVLNESINKDKDISGLKLVIDQLTSDVNDKNGKLTQLNSQLQEKTREVESLRHEVEQSRLVASMNNDEEMSHLKQTVDRLGSEMTIKNSELTELNTLLHHKTQEMQLLKQQIETMKENELVSKDKEVLELKMTIDRLNSDIASKDDQLTDLQAQLRFKVQALELSQQELEQARASQSQLVDVEVSSLKRIIEELQSNYQKSLHTLAAKDSEITSLRNELNATNVQLQVQISETGKLVSMIKRQEQVESEYRRHEALLAAIVEREEQAKRLMNDVKEQQSEHKKRVNMVEKQAKELELKRTALEEQEKTLKQLQATLDERQTLLPKNEELHEKERSIRSRESQVSAMEQSLKKLKSELAETQDRVSARQSALDEREVLIRLGEEDLQRKTKMHQDHEQQRAGELEQDLTDRAEALAKEKANLKEREHQWQLQQAQLKQELDVKKEQLKIFEDTLNASERELERRQHVIDERAAEVANQEKRLKDLELALAQTKHELEETYARKAAELDEKTKKAWSDLEAREKKLQESEQKMQGSPITVNEKDLQIKSKPPVATSSSGKEISASRMYEVNKALHAKVKEMDEVNRKLQQNLVKLAESFSREKSQQTQDDQKYSSLEEKVANLAKENAKLAQMADENKREVEILRKYIGGASKNLSKSNIVDKTREWQDKEVELLNAVVKREVENADDILKTVEKKESYDLLNVILALTNTNQKLSNRIADLQRQAQTRISNTALSSGNAAVSNSNMSLSSISTPSRVYPSSLKAQESPLRSSMLNTNKPLAGSSGSKSVPQLVQRPTDNQSPVVTVTAPATLAPVGKSVYGVRTSPTFERRANDKVEETEIPNSALTVKDKSWKASLHTMDSKELYSQIRSRAEMTMKQFSEAQTQ